MNFFLPKPIQTAIHTLNAKGFEAYLVGGAVRDYLRGEIPQDFDICTSAEPQQIMLAFKPFQVIPTGIKYGTITVIIDQFPLEITTYRQDKNYLDSRHPQNVEFALTLKEDLARRDFTINALAYHPDKGLIDYFEGLSDLKNHLLRSVGDASKRFHEDALRMLRALRFASTLDLTIESITSQAIIQNYPLLEKIAQERIRVELEKILLGKNCQQILLNYREIFSYLIPELKATFDFKQQNPHHIYDVYRHTVEVISSVPPITELRLAALFHDIAKPLTFSKDEMGIGHFYGHAALSAKLTRNIMVRLRFDNKMIDTVSTIIKYHDTPLPDSKTLLKKRISKLGLDMLYSLIEFQKADTLGQSPDLHQERLARLDLIRKMVRELENEKPPFSVTDLEVNGYDAIHLGLKGKQIGFALNTLLKKVLSDEIKNEQQVLCVELAKIAAQFPTNQSK